MYQPIPDLSAARILISNDDGIDAPGLAVLEEVARSLCPDVWVVAPDRERSGASHALTLQDPIRLSVVGERRYAVSGTPTDCVLLAINHLMDRPPDLVLSGVNAGANMASDVHYSGTVAAAMEGTLLNVRAIAFSQVFRDGLTDRFGCARAHAATIIERLSQVSWDRRTLINVNFPGCQPADITGISVVSLGTRKPGDEVISRKDPKGRPYVWIGNQRSDDEIFDGTDLAAIENNRITITPISVDMTDFLTMKALHYVF